MNHARALGHPQHARGLLAFSNRAERQLGPGVGGHNRLGHFFEALRRQSFDGPRQGAGNLLFEHRQANHAGGGNQDMPRLDVQQLGGGARGALRHAPAVGRGAVGVSGIGDDGPRHTPAGGQVPAAQKHGRRRHPVGGEHSGGAGRHFRYNQSQINPPIFADTGSSRGKEKPSGCLYGVHNGFSCQLSAFSYQLFRLVPCRRQLSRDS